MVSVEKSHLKKWMATKVLGRLPKPLLSAHHEEWGLEKPLDMIALSILAQEASKRKPSVRDPRPIGEWYVIPNRNNMREFHNEFVTVRIFPRTGTFRAIAGQEMDFATFQRHVKIAFLKGGLSSDVAELKVRLLIPTEKQRTFRVGPVTPFKIDFYKDSLGITLGADGSHPDHIEVREQWPSWIKPQLHAQAKQTEVITALTEQMKLHLSVMKGIDTSARLQAETAKRQIEATDKLTKAVDRLHSHQANHEDIQPFSLRDWLREVSKRRTQNCDKKDEKEG